MNKATESAVYRKAAEYVRKGWRQHQMATDKDGFGIWPSDPEACNWCLLGAVYAAMYALNLAHTAPFRELFPTLYSVTGADMLQDWNDRAERTLEEVEDALLQAAHDAFWAGVALGEIGPGEAPVVEGYNA